MINLDVTQFQNRLSSTMPLLFFLFFLLLLFGAWFSYILMRKQRKDGICILEIVVRKFFCMKIL